MENRCSIVIQDRTNLVDGVEQALLDYIVDNKLVVGDPIPYESELSQVMGVARHVVREALSRLKSRGIIVGKKHCGMTLSEPQIGNEMDKAVIPQLLSKKTLVDLLELRFALELSIVPMIFERVTEDDIKDLKSILSSNGVEGDILSVDFEQTFHSRIYSITGNVVMENILKVLIPVFRYIHDNFSDFGVFSDSIRERGLHSSHSDIIDALESRDSEKYSDVMRRHLMAYSMYIEKFKKVTHF